MNRTGKNGAARRLLSLLLVLAVMLPLLPRIEQPAEAANISGGDNSSQTGDIFQQLGLDTTSRPDDQAQRADSNPYGMAAGELVTVNELLVYGSFASGDDPILGKLAGHNVATDADYSNANATIELAFNFPDAINTEKLIAIKGVEGNFTGSGKRDKMAYLLLCEETIDGTDYYVYKLAVSDILPDGAANSNLILIAEDVGKIETSKATGNNVLTSLKNLCIATGDYNGSGTDSVFLLSVASYYSGSSGSQYNCNATLYCYQQKQVNETAWKSGENWSSDTVLSGVGRDEHSIEEGSVYSLATGDLNRDGLDDIAFVASRSNEESHGSVVFGSSSDSPHNLYRLQLDGLPGNTALAPLIGIAINNADQNPGNELLVAHFNRDRSSGDMPISVYVYSYDYNTTAHGFTSFYIRLTGQGGKDRISKYLEGYNLPLCIAASPLYGYGTHPVIAVNGLLFEAPDNGLSPGCTYKIAGSIEADPGNLSDIDDCMGAFTTYSIRPATLNGTDYGFAYHYLYPSYHSPSGKVEAEQHMGIYIGEDGEDSKATLTHELAETEPAFIALPNTDNDSAILRYKDYHYLYSDPTVLAALASPPYYRDLERLEGGSDYVLGSSTSYSDFKEVEEGESSFNTFSVGAYVSTEFEIKAPFVKANIEAEVEYNHSWTKETETRKTVTESITYSTFGGQDSVVLYALPLDVYVYELEYPADEEGGASKKMNYEVVVPYSSIYTIVPVETYERVREAFPEVELPQIAGNVFTHTLGQPDTYPKSAAGYRDAYTSERNGQVATGSASMSVDLTIAESESETTSQSNAVDIKAGGGVTGSGGVVKVKVTGGVTGGWEGGAGTSVTNTAGNSYTGTVNGIPRDVEGQYVFNWRMMQYNYRGSQNFPVVTYLVTNERSPAALPDEYWVEKTDKTEVTLNWAPSRDDPNPGVTRDVEYQVYRVLPSGSQTQVSDQDESSAIVYDKQKGVYTFTDSQLFPGNEYRYVLKVRRVQDILASVESAVIKAYTKSNITGDVAVVPGSLTLRPGGSGQLSGTLSTSSAYTANYSWLKLVKGEWKSITTSGGLSTNRDKLTFAPAQESQAGQYRLEAAVQDSTGSISTFLSNIATVDYAAYESASTLTVSANKLGVGDLLAATVQVTGSGTAQTPTGMVTLSVTDQQNEKNTLLAPLNSGVASFSHALREPGLYTLTATYSGDASFGSSAAEPVTVRYALEALEVPIYTSSFNHSTATYGDSDAVVVKKYSKDYPDGDAVTPSYKLERGIIKNGAGGKKEKSWEEVNGWISDNTITYKAVGEYRLTLTSGSWSQAHYFTVLPRPVSIKINDVSEQMPHTPDQSELNAALVNGSSLATGDTLSTIGYASNDLALYSTAEAAGGAKVTDIGSIKAGFYTIRQDETALKDAQKTALANYAVLSENGLYQLVEQECEITYTAGENGGLTVLAPSGLRSGSSVYKGSVLALTATPDEGYRVKGWTVNGAAAPAGTVQGNSLTIASVQQSLAIAVSFEEAPLSRITIADNAYEGNPATYTLQADGVAVEPSGGVYTVDEGATVTVLCSPPAGMEIDSAKLDGSPFTGGTVTFVASGDHEIEFTFSSPSQFTLSWNENPTGGSIDSVTVNGEAAVQGDTYDSGSVVTVSATPEQADHTVDRWRIEDGSDKLLQEGFTSPYSFVLTTDMEVDVTFMEEVFWEVALQEGAHSTITADFTPDRYPGSLKVSEGATATFTVESSDGYALEAVTLTVDGEDDDFDNIYQASDTRWICTVNAVSGDLEVTSEVAGLPRSYSITVQQSDGGHIAVTPADSAPTGSEVSIAVSPDSKMILKSLVVQDSKGNSVKLATVGVGTNSYSFVMPADRVTISATYATDNSGNKGGGGGGVTVIQNNTTVVEEKTISIVINNQTVEISEIDLTKEYYRIFIQGDTNRSSIDLDYTFLEELRAQKKDYILDIATDYGVFRIPVDLANLVPGLSALLSQKGLAAKDITFRVTLTDMGGDAAVKNALASQLPAANILGGVLDYRIEVVSRKTGESLLDVKDLAGDMVRMVPTKSRPVERYGAYRFAPESGSFKFVPHRAIYVDGEWYSAISSNTLSIYLVAENEVHFADVPYTHWGMSNIEVAAAKRLMVGVGDRMFQPDRNVTRAEFAQMLANMLWLPATERALAYDDVSPTAWYYDAVRRSSAAGLLGRFAGGSLLPDQALTREELATVLASVLRYSGTQLPTATDLSTHFADWDEADADLRSDIAIVYAAGLLVGVSDDRFDPKGETTRAQAATVQLRLLRLLGSID